MSTEPTNVESEITSSVINDENVSFNSSEISSDEHFAQLMDSINLSTSCEETNTDDSQLKSSTSTTRTAGQTSIGAKLVKKLEALGTLMVKYYHNSIRLRTDAKVLAQMSSLTV